MLTTRDCGPVEEPSRAFVPCGPRRATISLAVGAVLLAACILAAATTLAADAPVAAKAWSGTLTLPTYPWTDDINPKFWALEGGAKLSTTVHGAVVYPYVMQDHLSRRRETRTYKALFLENEYLKVTCLPELGGRLHSVFDKTTGQEMFHTSRVIKPGMIAMRGAWISGGVEWNTGPHGHTVTIVSPVSAAVKSLPDGSACLEVSNLEQIFRTRWTVRVTLHPGKAYLDEQISIYNPTDGMHPYYFWNCTAFPNRPGTRFIYPMTLGTDHNAREFFRWPIHEGRDLTWLKNYPTYASVFSVNCTYDFFGAYDVDANRGIVQVANHHELGGKKAWTWGEWEFGKVAQKNLSDDEGPYIEVQSGPLPTQSDYGMLGPHESVSWHEYWYPVHGLGDGFEFATADLAAQAQRREGRLELRLLATANNPQAKCVLRREGREVLNKTLDLAPAAPVVVTLDEAGTQPVAVRVADRQGRVLADFTTPLPIPKVEPPDPAKFKEPADDALSVEELCLKGRKFDRATDRRRAREYYEKALARDPGHVASLRSLAVLDFEAGLYAAAIQRTEKALERDSDDGLCWYYLGASRFRLGDFADAIRCGHRAVRCPGTESLGHDLVGRGEMRSGNVSAAMAAFGKGAGPTGSNEAAFDHWLLALRASRPELSRSLAERWRATRQTAIMPRALLALADKDGLAGFARDIRGILGEADFELLETSLVFAELGLFEDAGRLVEATCIEAVPPTERSFLPLYYLAWFAAQRGDATAAHRWLTQAAATHKERVFASRAEEVEILQYAAKENPGDAQAQLQLGCLLANLGRVEEAVSAWQKAVEGDPKQSIAWRNLGLAAAAKNDLGRAAELFRKAIGARPSDQTLYRDLAEILIAAEQRPEAIRLLETMPLDGLRRAEITVLLAQAYVDQQRFDDCVKLLEAAPYFVNWEGQDITWRLFSRAHLERGRQHLEKGETQAALADFDAALTYPTNLNVGRSNKPEEAAAQYWRGQALAKLGRTADARAAWQAGADGADVKGVQNEYREKCREALAGKKP